MSIGRIMVASGLPSDKPAWTWNCYVLGRPCRLTRAGPGPALMSTRRGSGRHGRASRAGLPQADIERAQGYAERSAEALA